MRVGWGFITLGGDARPVGFRAPHCLQVAADPKQPGVRWLGQLGVGHCQSPGLPGWNIEKLSQYLIS